MGHCATHGAAWRALFLPGWDSWWLLFGSLNGCNCRWWNSLAVFGQLINTYPCDFAHSSACLLLIILCCLMFANIQWYYCILYHHSWLPRHTHLISMLLFLAFLYHSNLLLLCNIHRPLSSALSPLEPFWLSWADIQEENDMSDGPIMLSMAPQL